MTMFEECVKALDAKAQVLSNEETKAITKKFEQMFPIYWIRIDWAKFTRKTSINSLHEIIPALEKLLQKPVDPMVYIIWSHEGDPSIRTNLEKIIAHFEDVECVSPEKFFVNFEQGYVIEARINGEITVGIAPNAS